MKNERHLNSYDDAKRYLRMVQTMMKTNKHLNSPLLQADGEHLPLRRIPRVATQTEAGHLKMNFHEHEDVLIIIIMMAFMMIIMMAFMMVLIMMIRFSPSSDKGWSAGMRIDPH